MPDTNILWRGGAEGLDFVRTAATEFNRLGGVTTAGWQKHMLEMHQAFVSRNLSPGGSADLVAATWAVHEFKSLFTP